MRDVCVRCVCVCVCGMCTCVCVCACVRDVTHFNETQHDSVNSIHLCVCVGVCVCVRVSVRA